jgi:hypothetical protein
VSKPRSNSTPQVGLLQTPTAKLSAEQWERVCKEVGEHFRLEQLVRKQRAKHRQQKDDAAGTAPRSSPDRDSGLS